MSQESCNCIVCATEYSLSELESIALSNHFKICQSCLDKSDPADDYRQAREIVMAYFSDPEKLFKEANYILTSMKNELK
jgi:hypothetical protein